jgi:hypothetical protein
MRTALTLITLFLALPSPAYTLPLIPLASDEGVVRLARSHRVDLFPLMNHYRTQLDRISCGPTSASIVLNALYYQTEKAPFTPISPAFAAQMPEVGGKKYDARLRAFTPESFLNARALQVKTLSRIYAEPVDGKRDPGLQLEQLRRMLVEGHGVGVEKFVITDQSKDLTPLKESLKRAHDYAIINYSRKSLGQPGGGHLSPVGAYDENSDSFLILDVNPSGGPWVWVESKDLIDAMNTFDTIENRGYLIVSDPNRKAR